MVKRKPFSYIVNRWHLIVHTISNRKTVTHATYLFETIGFTRSVLCTSGMVYVLTISCLLKLSSHAGIFQSTLEYFGLNFSLPFPRRFAEETQVWFFKF